MKKEGQGKLEVNKMTRFISVVLIVAGLAFLLYGGNQLWQSYVKEGERLDEAKSIVSEEVKQKIEKEFNYDFKTGETIGILYIPKLEREIPIVEGTDEEELAQGVGHYSDTGYPGENTQILLSGHRDTVFRQFGELEHGDEFHVKMENGTFIYEILDHEIVSADNRTVIDPSRKEEYLTVSTCYPFSYIGNAPDRYVVYAYPK